MTQNPSSALAFDGPLDSLHLQSYAYTAMHFYFEDQRDMFNLNPPYQRGSVWDDTRKQNLIRSMLLGVPVGAIVLNLEKHGAKGYTVIDGKQRIEAIRGFVDSAFPIPSSWVDPADVHATVDVPGWPVPGVFYEHIGRSTRQQFQHRSVPAVESQGKTVAEQAEIYRLINTGGIGHTDAELARAAAVEAAS